MRVMLCASLYNHDHSPRAADDEEYAEVYAGVIEPDEEFGPEPY
jgi:hypothetical protein